MRESARWKGERKISRSVGAAGFGIIRACNSRARCNVNWNYTCVVGRVILREPVMYAR